MSMKISRLATHWDADEACLIISFLNELSDSLWETYGDQIIEHQQHYRRQRELDTQAAPPLSDDDLDF